jgi:hypothetical protein
MIFLAAGLQSVLIIGMKIDRHVYSRVDLKWDGLKLRLKSGRLLATVETDSKHEGMFRIRLPNGHLTDMVNLTWAKDAAIALACADLNKQNRDISRAEASPVRPNRRAAGCSRHF